MKSVFFLVVFTLLSFKIYPQDRSSSYRLLKIGVNPIYPFELENGFFLRVLFESNISKLNRLTISPEFNYERSVITIKDNEKTYMGYGDRFSVRCNFKWYPLVIKKKYLRGFYVGLSPAFVVSEIKNGPSASGPGVDFVYGLQMFIKDKFSLSIDNCMGVSYKKYNDYIFEMWHFDFSVTFGIRLFKAAKK